MRHAVIMAGGAGTRLWPLSRRMRPKQMMRLFDGASLLQLARRRLDGLFEPANIWVITSAAYIDLVAAELPDLPRENLIGEPVGRDTANAVGLAAHLLALRDPHATMAVFTADHVIEPQAEFARAISLGLDAAEQHPAALVTFGITPDSPHTGYGYVQRGEVLTVGTCRAVAFREKPDRPTAEQYLRSGGYLWNSGMFAWRVDTIIAELAKSLPANNRELQSIAADWPKIAGTPALHDRFAALQRISIDFAVMEKAAQVLVVELNARWIDLGSWTALETVRPPDKSGNTTVGAESLVLDGTHNILVADDGHLIASIGVSDLVIIHSADATLICHRDHVQRIKDLAELRRKKWGERYE